MVFRKLKAAERIVFVLQVSPFGYLGEGQSKIHI